MSSGAWWPGFVGSTITAVTFTAVAVLLAHSLRKQGQWRNNPLGVATMLIFATCGLGHAIHTLQMLYPLFAPGSPIGAAARLHYGEWHLWVADGATAAAGTFYWLGRRRFPHLVSGTAMYENLRRRQRRAIEVHDNVVQGLVKAQWNLELQDSKAALAALDATLSRAADLEQEIAATQAATEDAP